MFPIRRTTNSDNFLKTYIDLATDQIRKLVTTKCNKREIHTFSVARPKAREVCFVSLTKILLSG